MGCSNNRKACCLYYNTVPWEECRWRITRKENHQDWKRIMDDKNQWLAGRAKIVIVRTDFLAGNEHWTKGGIQRNHLRHATPTSPLQPSNECDGNWRKGRTLFITISFGKASSRVVAATASRRHYRLKASRTHSTCLREQIVESVQSPVPSTCFSLDKREQFTRRRGKDEKTVGQCSCRASARCILSINYAIIRIRCDMNYCLPFTNLARKLAWNSENEHGIDKKRMDIMYMFNDE
eukprot:scaffold11866_cov70-Skeletonema_menzelii.AAC.2